MPPINIYAEGADKDGLMRVEQSLDQFRQDMPNIAVQSVADARQRRMF
ncbi:MULTISPECIES: hypothetical protein [unclassified Brevundimonas]|nr:MULTISPECIES: hypothetical protein [unclassified Brevundimonas]